MSENRRNDEENTGSGGSRGYGIATGLALGVLYGIVFDQLAIGIALGVVFGVVYDEWASRRSRGR